MEVLKNTDTPCTLRIEVGAAVARVARNTINPSNSDRHKATSAEGSNLFPRNWNQTND